jgi:hypothetical protein
MSVICPQAGYQYAFGFDLLETAEIRGEDPQDTLNSRLASLKCRVIHALSSPRQNSDPDLIVAYAGGPLSNISSPSPIRPTATYSEPRYAGSA